MTRILCRSGVICPSFSPMKDFLILNKIDAMFLVIPAGSIYTDAGLLVKRLFSFYFSKPAMPMHCFAPTEFI